MNLLWMQSEMNLKSMRLFLGLDPGVVGEKGLEEYVPRLAFLSYFTYSN